MQHSGAQTFLAVILLPVVLIATAWLLHVEQPPSESPANIGRPATDLEGEADSPRIILDEPVEAPRPPAALSAIAAEQVPTPAAPPAELPAGTPDDFLAYVRGVAAELRKDDAAWQASLAEIREKLSDALGLTVIERHPELFACELEPRNLGELQRDGYRVEKVIFQTFPGVWMTSNVYVPEGEGPFPAVLCVHGHWRGAKQEPTVQARCIGLAKLGFLVLCVDAFGAGERGLGKALGEYHGEMVAATLWPTGLTLAGIQVYENRRALDYLAARGDVDMDKLGVTGASGGGNQTMYAGALESRFKAVVPTCSVGNYQAYLGAACCMCEVVPGALQFTEEWGVLALVAPRALMVTSATRDARQFSVAEAQKSIEAARAYLTHHNLPHTIKHTIIESGHDYNQPMREAMYGWMTLHLKGEGDGGPIDEPAIQTEEPEALRCFPGDSRPDDWVTLPQFAARVGKAMLEKKRQTPKERDAFLKQMQILQEFDIPGGDARKAVRSVLLNDAGAAPDATQNESSSRQVRFESEPGVNLTATIDGPLEKETPLALLLNLEGAQAARDGALYKALREKGWSVATMDLRGTGALAVPKDSFRRAPDHNSAEWSLWLGQPLIRQWNRDANQFFAACETLGLKMPAKLAIIGEGPASILITGVAPQPAGEPKSGDSHAGPFLVKAAVGGLASYLSDAPYEGQRLGILLPGILQQGVDIPQLMAANVRADRLVIAGGVRGDGEQLSDAELKEAYRFTSDVFNQLGQAGRLTISADLDANQIVDLLSKQEAGR